MSLTRLIVSSIALTVRAIKRAEQRRQAEEFYRQRPSLYWSIEEERLNRAYRNRMNSPEALKQERELRHKKWCEDNGRIMLEGRTTQIERRKSIGGVAYNLLWMDEEKWTAEKEDTLERLKWEKAVKIHGQYHYPADIIYKSIDLEDEYYCIRKFSIDKMRKLIIGKNELGVQSNGHGWIELKKIQEEWNFYMDMSGRLVSVVDGDRYKILHEAKNDYLIDKWKQACFDCLQEFVTCFNLNQDMKLQWWREHFTVDQTKYTFKNDFINYFFLPNEQGRDDFEWQWIIYEQKIRRENIAIDIDDKFLM